MKTAHDRPDRDAERVGRFLIREPVEVDELDSMKTAARDVRHRFVERGSPAVPRTSLLDRVTDRRQVRDTDDFFDRLDFLLTRERSTDGMPVWSRFPAP